MPTILSLCKSLESGHFGFVKVTGSDRYLVNYRAKDVRSFTAVQVAGVLLRACAKYSTVSLLVAVPGGDGGESLESLEFVNGCAIARTGSALHSVLASL